MAFQDIGLRFLTLGAGEFRREIASSRSALTGMESDLRKIAGTSAGFGTKLTALGSGMSRLGQMMTTSLTLPILALEGALVGAGILFEDAFAGVGKTVDGVSDDFGNLTKKGIEIRDQFRALALEIPISVNELARIGETAGQLGIAQSELTEFVKTVALLGVTTDLTSEEAATFFARLGNIMGIAAKDMAEFTAQAGSTVVDLGNKFAATEQEIAHLSLRIAGAGQAAGLSTQEILALATAMASLGIQSEMGGSAISRVLLEIKRATDDFTATGGEATDQLKLFAKAAGLTVDQFTALVKNSPEEALLSLLGGINRLQDAGLLTNDMLKEMNLDTIRLQDMMNRLGPNIDFVRTALVVANKEWGEGNALQIEAQKRFNTTKSQLILLKNAFVDLGIEIFYLIKEPLDGLIKGLRFIIMGFRSLDGGVLKSALKFGLLLAAVGPIMAALGTVVQILGLLITGFGAVSLPILIAVGAVVALGTAVSTNFLGIRDRFEDLVGTAKKVAGAFKYVGFWLGKAFNFGKGGFKGNIFSGLSSSVKALTYIFEDAETTFFSKILQAFGMSEGAAQSFGMSIRNFLAPALNTLSNILNLVGSAFNIVSETASQFFDSLFTFLPSLQPALQSAFQGLLAGDFERVWMSLQIAAQNFLLWFQVSGGPILQTGLKLLLNLFNKFIAGVLPVVVELTKTFLQWIIDATAKAVPLLGSFINSILKWVGDQLPDIAKKLGEWGKEFINWLVRATPIIYQKLGSLGLAVIKWLGDKIPELVEQFLLWSAKFVDWLGPVTRDILPKLGEFIGAILGRLVVFLYVELPPKMVLLALAFISWVGEAIIKVAPELAKYLMSVLNFIVYSLIPGAVNAIMGFGKSFVDGMLAGLNTSWIEVENWFNEKFHWIEDQWAAFWDQFSPSKKTEGWGVNLIKGLVLGLESQSIPLNNAITQLMSNMSAGIQSGMGGDVMSPYTSVSSNNVTNVTNQSTRIYSPTINGANVSSDRAVGDEVFRSYRMAVLAHG